MIPRELPSGIVNKLLLFLLLLTGLPNAEAAYFQQEVNCQINVRLDDKHHELHAQITIEYINNSPDELTFIWVHLWPNAYKNNSTALARQMLESGQTKFYFAKDEDKGYIDSLEFKIDGQSVNWEYHPDHIDIAKLILNNPLKPGGKIEITTPFHVKVPKGIFSRLGHMGESYQITQWYPKPAVYDQSGWHEMPYLNQGEFYSEYGTYDVSITLPKNYIVGATGDLQNEEEMEWLSALAEKTAEKTSFTKSNEDAFPESSREYKTLRYVQSNVHDFAWFTDKRYHVLKGEVELPHSKRKVTSWVMFTDAEAELWKESIEYVNDAIYYYSLWNGDYPYNQVTAVDGALSAGGGMEYPTITVIGGAGSAFFLEVVIIHEVGHNWFYGILGSNERDHPWMDEGINSFNEHRYCETKYPNAGLLGPGEKWTKLLKFFDLDQYGHKTMFDVGYTFNARRNADQPIELPAAEYTPMNYGGVVYAKTALVFEYLRGYLGDSLFDQCMHAYYDRWKFRHPQPHDLKQVMEEVSGKDLAWFFEQLLQGTDKIDYKISRAKKRECPPGAPGDCRNITIKNKGDGSYPYSISAIVNDSVIDTRWFEGFKGKQSIDVHFAGFDKLRVDGKQQIPEINRKNNTLRKTGMLRKMEKPRLQLLGSLENPNRCQLYYSPIMGWNKYDGVMAGLALYNSVIPSRKFTYLLAPMYSFGTSSPVGSAALHYSIYPGGIFQTIKLGVTGSRYHNNNNALVRSHFTRFIPQLDIDLRKKNPRSNNNHSFNLRSVNIIEFYETFEPDVSSSNDYQYNEINYSWSCAKTLNPFQLAIAVQHNTGFLKASAEFTHHITYKPRKGFDLRLFAGKFIYNSTTDPKYNWRMDGQSGFFDYTYDEIFLGRTETSGVLAQQFVSSHGGFKIPTGLGQSNDFIAAVNLSCDLPIPLPLAVFADLGLNAQGQFIYDAGVKVPLIKGVFEVYFPLLYAKEIQTEINTNGTIFGETVRFTLHLNSLNPLKLIQNIDI